jgi:hypothetical protein
MKMNKLASITLLLLSIGMYACSDTSDSGFKSNPIDSTNGYGTAPVEYNKNNDTTPVLPDENQGGGHKVNTPDGDSAPAATHQR